MYGNSVLNGEELREMLENLYGLYNRREYVTSDPLIFLYNYPDVRDREIAGLVASSLAFGNVKQINRSVSRVLESMGGSPRRYLLSSGAESLDRTLRGFKHRWIDSRQIILLLSSVRTAIEKFGTLEECFHKNMKSAGGDINAALSGFVSNLGGSSLRKGFLACPEKGSPCKRLYLYLRWMVREDEVDPGGWNSVSPSRLTVPLDTHMYRLSIKLGLTGRSQRDMRTAVEITDAFREISPQDPVKYDFALTRVGIINDRRMREFEDSLEETACQFSGDDR